MNTFRSSFYWRPSVQTRGAALLILGTLCSPSLTQADGLFISFYNSDTVGLYDAYNGSAINANFASVTSPIGLALGPDRNLYVGSDNLAFAGGGIARFGISGTSGTPLGTFVSHVSHNELNNPQGIHFSGGNLYVADATMGNIFVYNSAGTPINTLSSSLLSAPIGLTFDNSGTMYVADINQGNVLRYSGGTFSQVNSQPGVFEAARSVAVGPDGFLYVLNASSASGGVYKLSLDDGSTQKIIDYSTFPFQGSDLVVGPDGKLYVAGQDLFSAEGEILRYDLDGSELGVALDTGFNNIPNSMLFVPEPSVLSLAGLTVAAFAVIRWRSAKRRTAH